jgi:hypothetical protein
MFMFWMSTPCWVQMEGAHSSETWNALVIRQRKGPEDRHLSNRNKLTNHSNTKFVPVLKHRVMNVCRGMGANLSTY